MLSRFRNGVVMAGDAVHWTPEMRRAMSEKMKARRASDSKEQKEARKLKRSETMKLNPNIERRRVAAISQTRRQKRDVLRESARKSWIDPSPTRSTSLANLERRSDPDVRARACKTRDQHAINAKIARSVQADWDTMSLEHKIARSRKAVTIAKNLYVMCDGSIQSFKGS
jgi:hypothetical protein